jgi:hypothetical protein
MVILFYQDLKIIKKKLKYGNKKKYLCIFSNNWKKKCYHVFLKTIIFKKMVRNKTIFFSHFEKGPILFKNLQKPPKRGVTLEFEWFLILTPGLTGRIFQKPPFDPRADAFKFSFILAFSAHLDPCHKHIFQKFCYQNEKLMHLSKYFWKNRKTKKPWYYWWFFPKKIVAHSHIPHWNVKKSTLTIFWPT